LRYIPRSGHLDEVAVKNRKIFIAVLFCLLSAASLVFFSEASETADMKNRMTDLRKNIDYLTSRHFDTAEYLKRFGAIEKEIAEYENAASGGEAGEPAADNSSLKKVIDVSAEMLDREVAEKIASVKRLETLYLVMLAFGATTGVAFAFYIVVMYNKRK